MIKQLLTYSLLALILLFGSTACSDDYADDAAKDTTPPKITVINPTDGSTVSAGSTVMVSGTIEEEGELEQVSITVKSGIFSQTEVYEKADLPEKSGNLYQLSQPYEVPQAAAGATVNITITALDNAGLTGSKSLTITVN